jgi:hypothetical protein
MAPKFGTKSCNIRITFEWRPQQEQETASWIRPAVSTARASREATVARENRASTSGGRRGGGDSFGIHGAARAKAKEQQCAKCAASKLREEMGAPARIEAGDNSIWHRGGVQRKRTRILQTLDIPFAHWLKE